MKVKSSIRLADEIMKRGERLVPDAVASGSSGTNESQQSEATPSGFDVKPSDNAWASWWLFDIASKHYVTARVSILIGMLQTGVLLSHQSIESYLKGLAYISNRSGTEHYYFDKKNDPTRSGQTRIWSHDLVQLIKKVGVHNPELNKLV